MSAIGVLTYAAAVAFWILSAVYGLLATADVDSAFEAGARR